MRIIVRTNIVTQTTVKHSNRTRKTIYAFVSFVAVLLALTCPSFQRRATAQDQMDDDMDMRWVWRPIGMVGALVDDGFVPYPFADKAYTSLDYPGAVLTSAFGINNKGNIVGFFQDASKNLHGFFYNRVTSSFASIDNPNPVCTTGTDARGINKRGDIVGTCTDDANNFHGYLLTAEGFSSVQAPGHRSTIPQGITSDRKIFGCIHATFRPLGLGLGVYRDADGRIHGYLLSADGEFASIDFPGATLTRAFGINSDGDIVGTYVASGVQHAFVRSAKRHGNQ